MATNTALLAPLATGDPAPSPASLYGLDAVNFLLAGLLAGFGPYVAAYLADQKWTQERIGFVLTVSGIAGLLAQLPGGELLDFVRSKRALVALGVTLTTISALIIAFQASFPLVLAGLALEGSAGGFLGPAIASISLGLVGHGALAERLGRNQRFASTGGLVAAGLMGLIGYFLAYRAIFLITATLALPLFVALIRIRAADIHFGRSCGRPDHHGSKHLPRDRRRSFWKNSALLTFAGCLFLFQLANASVLPLAGEALAYNEQRYASLSLSALIIVPQIIVALIAPWAGRQAHSRGRRPLLLIGFGALPIRALLFTWTANPLLLAGVQVLDGISGATLGVLTALVVADLTNGTGRFNLAQGIIGAASGAGASLSTTLSGVLATSLGRTTGFLGIAMVALFALLMVGFLMPETRPSPDGRSTLV